MNGMMVLAGLALALHVTGAAGRTSGGRFPLRALAWAECAAAGWLVAAVAGVWSPLWPALLLGLLGCLAETLPAAAGARRGWVAGKATAVWVANSAGRGVSHPRR
jgi:hypothetical protein